MRRTLVIALLLALTVPAAPARADGDPASDVLLLQDVFSPYAPKVPKPRRVRLGPPPSKAQVDAVTVRVGEKPKRQRKAGAKAKNDPQHVAAARELRDRYLEHVNAGGGASALAGAAAKYDVSKALAAPEPKPTPLLHAA